MDTGQGEGEDKPQADQRPAPPEPEEPVAEAPAQPPAEPSPAEVGTPGGAESPPPAKREKAEAKPPAKEPPPPGGIADLFKEALPDVQFDAYQGVSNVIIEVPRDAIPNVMRAAKDDPRLDMSFLRCLFGVDHEAEGMEVVYELLSYDKGHTATLKTRLSRDDLSVPSVVSVWNAADWHERETRDMFGITFDGHPHLIPLLLPEDMTDHFPLRKDNPLAEIEEWQGDLLDDVGQAGHIPSGSRSEGVSPSAEGEE